jgi:hypothetical protein
VQACLLFASAFERFSRRGSKGSLLPEVYRAQQAKRQAFRETGRPAELEPGTNQVKDKEKESKKEGADLPAYSENFRTALRAGALGRRLAILQLYLLRTRNLYLFLALDAICFHFKNLRVFCYLLIVMRIYKHFERELSVNEPFSV